MQISRSEIWTIVDTIQSSLQKKQQDACGKVMFEARELMNKYELTVAGMCIEYCKALGLIKEDPAEKRSNDNMDQDQEEAGEMNYDIEDDGDPTTIWVVPWATKMLKKFGKDLPFKDARQLRKMQEKRFSSPRTVVDLEWLYDIAHRNGYPVPPEFFAYMKELQAAS